MRLSMMAQCCFQSRRVSLHGVLASSALVSDGHTCTDSVDVCRAIPGVRVGRAGVVGIYGSVRRMLESLTKAVEKLFDVSTHMARSGGSGDGSA